MPEFEYKAVSRDGMKSGMIKAGDESEAQDRLLKLGLSVLSLRVHRPLRLGLIGAWFTKLDSSISERMSFSEKILFTSQLSSMIKAGLPLVDALETFIEQKSESGSGRIISKIILKIQTGIKFSQALAEYPKVFNPAYLAVVRAGENSGTLGESLTYLSAQLRRENDLGNKVKSALIYPAVVITAMVTVMIFISISVIPKILLFAQSSGQKLPGYTLALVAGVSFLTKYWYLVIMVLAVFFVLFSTYAKSHSGSRFIGGVVLRLPIIGILVLRYNQARFARVLGGFYAYGVDIISSFGILADSLDSPLFRDACLRINNRITSGQTLADSISLEGQLFPSIMIRLIKGAEKTGDLGGALDKLALYYEEELEVALRNILALIEPALVFFLGFGVLALALVVVVPIYKITSTIK